MAIQGLEFDKPTLVDGGHEQKAIVNTASGKQPVNAPTVEDIKRIAKGEAEKEAEAASATEWEKSIKEHISYDKDDAELDVNTDINANGGNIYGVEDLITDHISCNELYSNEDDESVPASNLLDGSRVFKHDLTIDLGNATFFYVCVFNSSVTAITTVVGGQIATGCAGLYEGANYEVGYIESIESDGSIVIRINATTTISGMIDGITDDVTQC